MLADEMPNARMVQAESIYELRMHPERLTHEIARFLDVCWDESPGTARARRAARPRRLNVG
jgi:hypothetical protein